MKARGFLILDNPISNEGHLDSWHVLFVDLLLRDGWRIIALTSDPAGLARKLQTRGIVPGNDLLVEGDAVSDAANRAGSLRALWQRWNHFTQTRRYAPSTHGGSCGGPVSRAGDALLDTVVALIQRSVSMCHSAYRWVRRRSAGEDRTAHETHIDPLVFQQRVQACVERHPGEVFGVFSMYLDAYMPQAERWTDFRLGSDLPWMGLCITPSGQGAPEGYYALPAFRGACFLDEAFARQYRALLPAKHFASLPDITETALPSSPDPVALEIRRRAGTRRVVFMGGSIGRQKNLARWIGVILKADPSEWFFVQIGRINHNNLTPEDREALQTIQAIAPANLLVVPEYLPDERSFNAAIAASDVVFAVYLDFPRSSNMLSKAACFEKPILVADDYLMGERVRRYRIGLAVPPRDVDAVLAGLLSLEAIDNIKDNFRRYCDEFSEAKMQQALSSFVFTCVRT